MSALLLPGSSARRWAYEPERGAAQRSQHPHRVQYPGAIGRMCPAFLTEMAHARGRMCERYFASGVLCAVGRCSRSLPFGIIISLLMRYFAGIARRISEGAEASRVGRPGEDTEGDAQSS